MLFNTVYVAVLGDQVVDVTVLPGSIICQMISQGAPIDRRAFDEPMPLSGFVENATIYVKHKVVIKA